MPGFRCQACDLHHLQLPRDLAYGYPIEYFAVPAAEREARVDADDDFCIIDQEIGFIHGVLPMPVLDDGPDFGWGIWVLVKNDDFNRYVDWLDSDTEDKLPFFPGLITGPVGPYPDEVAHVAVHVHSREERPTFTVVSGEHPLAVAQQRGVTPQQAHDFVADVLKSQSRRPG